MSAEDDVQGITRATVFIHSLIEREINNGIPPHRIIIGGFSQGGALAIHAGLTYNKKLAGVVSLSGWLPLHDYFPLVGYLIS